MVVAFAENTLILTHLPDPRSGVVVPVAGVVVEPGESESLIVVCDLAGKTREIAVSNDRLSER